MTTTSVAAEGNLASRGSFLQRGATLDIKKQRRPVFKSSPWTQTYALPPPVTNELHLQIAETIRSIDSIVKGGPLKSSHTLQPSLDGSSLPSLQEQSSMKLQRRQGRLTATDFNPQPPKTKKQQFSLRAKTRRFSRSSHSFNRVDSKDVSVPSSILLKRVKQQRERAYFSLSPEKITEKKKQKPNKPKWYAKSRRGIKPGMPPNQDSYFIKQNIGGFAGATYIGVCDGHGTDGHLVSQSISKTIPNHLSKLMKQVILDHGYGSQEGKISQGERFREMMRNQENTDLDDIINLAFINASRGLKRQSFDSEKSGSSACTLLLAHQSLYSINTGDSRAVIGKRVAEDVWRGVQLSRDHKPSEEDERRRIVANNGRVMRLSGQTLRVWLPHKLEPGLAMTRTLGDTQAEGIGVTSRPQIKRYALNQEDKFVIVGSDGLWDKVSNQEAAAIVGELWECGSEGLAAGKLASIASERWLEDHSSCKCYMDDITVLVFMLKQSEICLA